MVTIVTETRRSLKKLFIVPTDAHYYDNIIIIKII